MMYALACEPQRSARPSEVEPPPHSVWTTDGTASTNWTELPHSFDDESWGDSDSSPTSIRNLKKMVVLLLAMVLISVSYYFGSASVRRALALKLHDAEVVRSSLVESHSRLLSEKSQLCRLSNFSGQLSQLVEQAKEDLVDKERALKEKKGQRVSREEEILKLFGQLQLKKSGNEQERRDDVANFIKTTAYDRYGVEPKKVEFQVRFWQDGVNWDDAFVVEVAGFEHMPVSSFLFLEQVEHGLWDRTAFLVNAPHVVMAEPISGSNGASRLPEMEEMGLARLFMPEYNDKMSHVKYTLGFGTDMETAGSYFYVNKMDNTDYHKGHACFGRVVRGFDVVDRIGSQETDEYFTIQPVEIKSVRLLQDSGDEQ